jgi:hypothetical protein
MDSRFRGNDKGGPPGGIDPSATAAARPSVGMTASKVRKEPNHPPRPKQRGLGGCHPAESIVTGRGDGCQVKGGLDVDSSAAHAFGSLRSG